ncbi:Flagellin N-methylase [Sedimentisphaera cyanobacteriorum]|uniref:Flagellin N-methylase n=1 Tax=Sedimentisphaera cyanobacteriorum TaxID=1940790 RepID=A0A1Q2HPK3_9BACT|nr:YkgJ family cysteine cluster protein [Sedimentisphaera cyanobacteriorum]AQQ09261.1 Flagellin N-methylase [Sedimentisphaera cyanobacteriorum]
MGKKNQKPDDMDESCKNCDGLCCRYIALPIDNPETEKDFDDISWYLCHENVSVFVEEGQWYVSFSTPCRYLCPETSMCLNYKNRPQICRNFDSESCEFNQDEYGYELHFKNDEELREYMKVKFENNLTDRGRKKRKNKKKDKTE